MALSGSSQVTFTNNSQFTLKVSWTATQNIANNTTTVSAKAQIISSTWGKASGWTDKPVSIVIGTSESDAQSFNGTFDPNMSANSSKQIYTASKTITHKADGTQSLVVTAAVNYAGVTWNGGSLGYVQTKGTYTITPILRASSMSLSSSTVSLGSDVKFTIDRASSSFQHKILYKIGNTSGTAIDKTTSTTPTWTPPLSLSSLIPSATSSSATLTLETYSGSTKVGTKNYTMTLNVPSNILPSLSSLEVSESDNTIKTLLSTGTTSDKTFVQTKSKIAIAITAKGNYSSTIKTVTAKIGSKTISLNLTSSSIYKGTLDLSSVSLSSSSQSITLSTTDSRSRTVTSSYSITAQAYSSPKITTFTAKRNSTNGTIVDVVRIGTYSTLMNSSNVSVNTLNSETSVGDIKTTTTNTGFPGNGAVTGVLETKSYIAKLTVSDKLSTTTATYNVPTSKVLFSMNKDKGIGIGKIHEQGVLDIGGGDVFLNKGIIRGGQFYTGSGLPVGDTTERAYWSSSTTFPDGYSMFWSPNQTNVLNTPTTHGFAEVLKAGHDFKVLWHAQWAGETWITSGNNTNFTSWVRVNGQSSGTFSSYQSNFKAYNETAGSANYPTVKRSSDLISLTGAVTNTAVLSTSAEVHIGTLPNWAKPQTDIMSLQQGSGSNKWLMRINTLGSVFLTRYGVASTIDLPVNQWLIIDCRYLGAPLL